MRRIRGGGASAHAPLGSGWPGCTVATLRYVARCLAVVLVSLCAFVGVVAVGRLADGLVALDERAERRGRRGDRRREPAELQIVGDRRCVPDAVFIHGRRDEARAPATLSASRPA